MALSCYVLRLTHLWEGRWSMTKGRPGRALVGGRGTNNEMSFTDDTQRAKKASLQTPTEIDGFDRFWNRVGSLPFPLGGLVQFAIGLLCMLVMTCLVTTVLPLAVAFMILIPLALVAAPFVTAWALSLIWPLPLAIMAGVAVAAVVWGLSTWAWLWERRANAGACPPPWWR